MFVDMSSRIVSHAAIEQIFVRTNLVFGTKEVENSAVSRFAVLEGIFQKYIFLHKIFIYIITYKCYLNNLYNKYSYIYDSYIIHV